MEEYVRGKNDEKLYEKYIYAIQIIYQLIINHGDATRNLRDLLQKFGDEQHHAGFRGDVIRGCDLLKSGYVNMNVQVALQYFFNDKIKIMPNQIQEKFDKKYDNIATKIKMMDLDNDQIFIQMKKSMNNPGYSEIFNKTTKIINDWWNEI